MAYDAVTKQFGVGIVFLLILIHGGCCKNINCDVNHCKALFSTLFKDFFKKGTERLCRSLDDTIECVDKCLQLFFPDFDFVNSKTSVASEVCSYDFQYDLSQHWSCISGHFHRLIACMSKFGSMKPTDISSETLKLLSCKKFLEVLNCPDEILRDCGEKATDIVGELFSKVFKTSMVLACDAISSNNAYDLSVTYSLNNSYISAFACLDKSPDEAGNCFTQYIKDFDANELYHCRFTCENHKGNICLPSSLMNDFYIPVLSFGKYSCKDSAIEDEVHRQEPTKASNISYDVGLASDVYHSDTTTDENADYIPSDEAKKSEVFPLNSDVLETSTLKFYPNTNRMEHDNVLSTTHSPNNFSTQTSIATSEVQPDINSLSSGFVTDNAKKNNMASRFEYCFQYVVACFIAVVVFL